MSALPNSFNGLKKQAGKNLAKNIKTKLTDGKIDLPGVKIPTVSYAEGTGTKIGTGLPDINTLVGTDGVTYGEGTKLPGELSTVPIDTQPKSTPPAETPVTPVTTPTVDKPMTYEEFIAKQRDYALDTKNQSYQAADDTRQKAVVDANASYQQNQSTYGARAESIGQAGLQGSGYGEYLNSMAYAQMRADKNAADAQANGAKLTADNNYNSYIQSLNKMEIDRADQVAAEEKSAADEKNGIYSQIIAGLNDGSLNLDSANAIAGRYGFTEEDTKAFEGIYSKYMDENGSTTGTNAETNIYQSIVENGTDVNVATEQAKASGASEEAIAAAVEKVQRTYAASIKNQITSGEVSSKAALDDQLSRGNITQTQYDELNTLMVAQNDKKVSSGYKNVSGLEENEENNNKFNEYMSNLDTLHENGDISDKAYHDIYAKDYIDSIGSCDSIDLFNNISEKLKTEQSKLGDRYNEVKTQLDKCGNSFKIAGTFKNQETKITAVGNNNTRVKNDQNVSLGVNMKVEVGGQTFFVEAGDLQAWGDSGKRGKVFGNTPVGGFCYYNGNLYYRESKSQVYIIGNVTNSKDSQKKEKLIEALQAQSVK